MSLSKSNPGKSLPSPSNYSSAQPIPSPSSFESTRPSLTGPSHSQPAPRKAQGSRKQHRNQRRPSANDRPDPVLDEYLTMAEFNRAAANRRGQTSITHLLDYSAPRSYLGHSHGHHSHARSYRRNTNWGSSGHYVADKSRFVHANYRFVVSPETTYANHLADADVRLDWVNIMQVIASTESQAASCPICLSEPVAPRMAKCGHIFCLPCVIRFMNSSSSDDEVKTGRGARWKKCPICEDSVYLHEIRPVRFYAGQECALPRVGDDVILRLMARSAGSTLALPKEGWSEAVSGDDVPWHFAANVLDYARIMKGTKGYMMEQFDEEVEALLQQEKDDETQFGQDGEWTQRAIKAVKASKEKLETLETALSIPSTASAKPSDADFYFYSTPPHLYLSPLDIRILKTKYGSFDSFPSTLLPRVEHISTGHLVDDALRKRAKYLGHLPHGCVISFLECDWTDIVPAETLESFAGDIERRRKRNRDKAAQEERERLQSERIEAAALRSSTGARRLPTPLEDERLPVMDLSEFQPLTSQSRASPPDPRPGFDTLASMSTSPSTQRTVWGTQVMAASPEMHATQPFNADDGWLKDDQFLGTAELALQLEAIDDMEKTGGPSAASTSANSNANGGGGGGGGKKKKKKQKITLMSTGGRRGN